MPDKDSPAAIEQNDLLATVLSKYIRYIREVEGVDYILDLDERRLTEVKFTVEEWAILTKAAEATKSGS